MFDHIQYNRAIAAGHAKNPRVCMHCMKQFHRLDDPKWNQNTGWREIRYSHALDENGTALYKTSESGEYLQDADGKYIPELTKHEIVHPYEYCSSSCLMIGIDTLERERKMPIEQRKLVYGSEQAIVTSISGKPSEQRKLQLISEHLRVPIGELGDKYITKKVKSDVVAVSVDSYGRVDYGDDDWHTVEVPTNRRSKSYVIKDFDGNIESGHSSKKHIHFTLNSDGNTVVHIVSDGFFSDDDKGAICTRWAQFINEQEDILMNISRNSDREHKQKCYIASLRKYHEKLMSNHGLYAQQTTDVVGMGYGEAID